MPEVMLSKDKRTVNSISEKEISRLGDTAKKRWWLAREILEELGFEYERDLAVKLGQMLESFGYSYITMNIGQGSTRVWFLPGLFGIIEEWTSRAQVRKHMSEFVRKVAANGSVRFPHREDVL